MSATFDKLMKMLEEKGSLANTDIEAVTKELGEMTPQEMIDLSAAQIKKQPRTEITMEQYLAATKVLDTAAEGSPEYEAALKIVETYEKA
ncbi:MAG: hypothetical protein BroJett018_13880 [Chloroflexota bacterium]|nr:hypothetical protein [Chloroflexota bacterium]NOG62937.1 hypothetical protein [Chloroflexota bacterium]GIK63594.1 MAG: hypothetical protein BroJett018_13880 [Chloroflexota bacterium]